MIYYWNQCEKVKKKIWKRKKPIQFEEKKRTRRCSRWFRLCLTHLKRADKVLNSLSKNSFYSSTLFRIYIGISSFLFFSLLFCFFNEIEFFVFFFAKGYEWIATQFDRLLTFIKEKKLTSKINHTQITIEICSS